MRSAWSLIFSIYGQLSVSRGDWDLTTTAVLWSCARQLSLFEPGRRAMLQDARVMEALRELTANGWTPEAKLCAHGALLALVESEDRAQSRTGNAGSSGGNGSTLWAGSSHIMMS